jgi:hypothetical protein
VRAGTIAHSIVFNASRRFIDGLRIRT